MTGKKTAKDTKPSTVVANDPDDLKGTLKSIGGSRSDHWNNMLANQTAERALAHEFGLRDPGQAMIATVAALVGIGRRMNWKE